LVENQPKKQRFKGIAEFRGRYRSRREASAKGETRSSRAIGRARSVNTRVRGGILKAREYSSKYGRYLKQTGSKESPAYHIGQDLRRNTPLIGTKNRKRGIRET
jgi:hypothetical protein